MIPAALADALIPAAAGMPSASAAGATDTWLERVLAARPDLGPELERIVASVDGEAPGAALARLERERPHDLETLLVAVAGAYYMSDDVRARLGYGGQRAMALDLHPDLTAYIEDGLLEPVLARGPRYRKVP